MGENWTGRYIRMDDGRMRKEAMRCSKCGVESCYGANGEWFCTDCWLARVVEIA